MACKVEAQAASEKADAFRAAGAGRIIALVKEDIGTEVAHFKEKYWKEEVMLDKDLAFYISLGGGSEPHKPHSGLCSLLAMLLNPFSKRRTKMNFKAAKRLSNNGLGEGWIAGGVYVLRKDGSAAYSFLEEDMGDRAPLEDVIASVKAEAGAAGGAATDATYNV